MSDDRAGEWRPTRGELLWRQYALVKWKLYMWAHKWFWRTLWAIGLAVPYSKFMCRRGWYRKFPDGRCMYCGEVH